MAATYPTLVELDPTPTSANNPLGTYVRPSQTSQPAPENVSQPSSERVQGLSNVFSFSNILVDGVGEPDNHVLHYGPLPNDYDTADAGGDDGTYTAFTRYAQNVLRNIDLNPILMGVYPTNRHSALSVSVRWRPAPWSGDQLVAGDNFHPALAVEIWWYSEPQTNNNMKLLSSNETVPGGAPYNVNLTTTARYFYIKRAAFFEPVYKTKPKKYTSTSYPAPAGIIPNAASFQNHGISEYTNVTTSVKGSYFRVVIYPFDSSGAYPSSVTNATWPIVQSFPDAESKGLAPTVQQIEVEAFLFDSLGSAAFESAEASLQSITSSNIFTTIDDSDPTNPVLTNNISILNAVNGAGHYDLVDVSAAPVFEVRTVTAGSGINITEDAVNNHLTITNTGSVSSLASTGGTESLVVDGTGPDFSVKGLTAGTGITLTPSATDVTITNSAPDQTVTLTSGTGIAITGIYPTYTIATTSSMASMPIGELSYEDSTGTTISMTITNTDYLINPGTTLLTTNNAAASPHFDSPSVGRLRYLGVDTSTFHVACSLSLRAAASNKEWYMSVFKNGVKIPRSGFWNENPTGSGATIGDFTIAYHIATTLTTNDYLELFIRNITDTSNIVVRNFNLVAMGTTMS